jgi:hypothetical protein
MVTDRQRRFIHTLIRLDAFRVRMFMRLPWIEARWRGSSWVLARIKRWQIVDDLHHAPCCPANHYHRTRLVFHPCTCGAAAAAVPEGQRHVLGHQSACMYCGIDIDGDITGVCPARTRQVQ